MNLSSRCGSQRLVPELHGDAFGADEDAVEADFAVEAAGDAIVLAHFERDAAAI
jgi:hypothetical protein